LVNGVIDGWSSEEVPHIHLYRAGTWGPYAADEFITNDIRKSKAL